MQRVTEFAGYKCQSFSGIVITVGIKTSWYVLTILALTTVVAMMTELLVTNKALFLTGILLNIYH